MFLQTYVQDLLLKNGPEVYRQMVHHDGHFYVCGDVSMAAQVSLTLETILSHYGNMTKGQSEKYVRKLRVSSDSLQIFFKV